MIIWSNPFNHIIHRDFLIVRIASKPFYTQIFIRYLVIDVTQKTKTWLKGKFKAVETNFINKMIGHRITIVDGLDTRFKSFMTVFIPKLSPKYPKPHLMLHLSNGAGTAFVRYKDPESLIATLEDMIDTIRSEKWTEYWWRAEDFSARLIDNGEIVLEEEIVDINEWKKEIMDVPELTIIGSDMPSHPDYVGKKKVMKNDQKS